MSSNGIVFLVPIFVGLAAVFQAGLNRRIAEDWGLSGATLVNATVFMLLSSCVYLFGYTNGKIQFSDFKVWYLIPGTLGFLLVMGLPFAISRLGALNTFLWLVSSQIIVSSLWDYWVEGQDFSWRRLMGGFIAILGAAIAVR